MVSPMVMVGSVVNDIEGCRYSGFDGGDGRGLVCGGGATDSPVTWNFVAAACNFRFNRPEGDNNIGLVGVVATNDELALPTTMAPNAGTEGITLAVDVVEVVVVVTIENICLMNEEELGDFEAVETAEVDEAEAVLVIMKEV